jgi:hypothetical protein
MSDSRIESAKVRNFKIEFVKMVYQVMAYMRSPNFVWYVQERLSHITNNSTTSLVELILGGMVDEIEDLDEHRWTEQFHEKQTLIALSKFMHGERTMRCLRQVYMSRANKYVNPESGMMTDGGAMTDEKALVWVEKEKDP